MDVYSFIISLVAILSLTSSVTDAATYASNVTTSDIGSNNAILTWLAPDSLAAVASFLLTVADEDVNVVFNVTISDVSVTSYEVTGLLFSTYHNATLETIDASGNAIGSDSNYFITDYDPLNLRAVCAIAVVFALILILIMVKAANVICNPDKAAAKWKQEILVTKQQEREEKKKKMSSQPFVGSRADLDLA